MNFELYVCVTVYFGCVHVIYIRRTISKALSMLLFILAELFVVKLSEFFLAADQHIVFDKLIS